MFFFNCCFVFQLLSCFSTDVFLLCSFFSTVVFLNLSSVFFFKLFFVFQFLSNSSGVNSSSWFQLIFVSWFQLQLFLVRERREEREERFKCLEAGGIYLLISTLLTFDFNLKKRLAFSSNLFFPPFFQLVFFVIQVFSVLSEISFSTFFHFSQLVFLLLLSFSRKIVFFMICLFSICSFFFSTFGLFSNFFQQLFFKSCVFRLFFQQFFFEFNLFYLPCLWQHVQYGRMRTHVSSSVQCSIRAAARGLAHC